MPSVEQLRRRLLKKLSELFQIDQPDLDFGFYRIMHAKAQEVQDFIGTDLLKIVADAFGDVDDARKADLQAAYEKAIQTAKDSGAPNPEETEPVKKAKAALDAVKDTASAEADVYDHLYRFFERYYDDGDFISRRYYTRETSGKAAPFAVPYNGEEVKLHWANADQYYVKSAEYFSNFTFDLRQAKEAQALKGSMDFGEDQPLKVHFRVVDATEGEHGNVKASDANKRFFILHAENPVALLETGEMVIHFEYRPDPEKTGQESTWRDQRNSEAVETILERLQAMVAAGGDEKQAAEYLHLFKIPAATDSDKKRPLLAKYVNQYTARNTRDYFIHKDLGGFLRRELDFYIKNEVMRLDDIENAEAPAVESYLAKIKVLRKIAGKLIDFLAQLEDFQKKLWLKKKFVVETQYCMTLDRIFAMDNGVLKIDNDGKWLMEQIVKNDEQLQEWINLGFIEKNETDALKKWLGAIIDSGKLLMGSDGKDLSGTADHKFSMHFVLDTRFFDDRFKARLVASMKNFDERCDGLLVHSENFQALNLLHERYREQVKCVYIDPPYNTSASEILYKNEYKHSSWLSLVHDRVSAAYPMMKKDANFCATIDDVELNEFSIILKSLFGKSNETAIVPIRINPSGRPSETGFALTHEYALFYRKTSESKICRIPRTDEQLARFNNEDEQGIFEYRNLRREGSNSDRNDGQRQFFPIYANLEIGTVRVPAMEWNEQKRAWIVLENPESYEIVIYPINDDGREKNWRWSEENIRKDYTQFLARIPRGGTPQVYYKYRPRTNGTTPLTLWTDTRYSATEHGTNVLKDIFNSNQFSYPKSVFAVEDCIRVGGAIDDLNMLIMDCFAGSGTTGHATININREDKGKRKYILVEMGDYFDTVLKPRIAKVVYSERWKDGRPLSNEQSTQHTKSNGSLFNGVSHCLKYIRLESYEDTLNNLRIDHNPQRNQAVAAIPALKEDYMLRYLLDVETRGSQSLLNIDAFADPTAYTLEVKKPGTDEYATRAVDLIETFNYLIGLRVVHYASPEEFSASFKRIEDPELPEDSHTKLVVDGCIRQIEGGPWWFRKVEDWVPKDAAHPHNGQQEKVLIVWRKLTDDIEQDNLMLDEWFRKMRMGTRDFAFDTIYVNGSNNLPNLKLDDENWNVRLIEEAFIRRMWEVV